ncbi:cell division protein SepF [Clostridium sp. MSJ-8]|uniref:cell division protein SepF n=1 Tax=Clostridium sp. MSJ-8 TaxID=2841510 RepID=UPI001C0EB0BD|nr:cell division protein SepF [Clostridium sp. MSJ-8]MBU5487557.1 cell division protein SepF [Clostridium sp. MSJ-8]
MSNVLTKMKTILGFGDYDEYDEFDDEYDDDVDTEEQEEEVEPIIQNKKNAANNKVVNIHTATSAKVIISRPAQYEDATEICDALKSRKMVVINTSALEKRIAQRLIDFISGSCYALGGELQTIENGVYLLTPSNVEVTTELKSELSSKALFNWK